MKPLRSVPLIFLLAMFLIPYGQTFANSFPSIFRLTNGLSYAKVPFRLINDLIVLQVTINGQTKLNFILDTGTRTPVVFNKKTVRPLNLPRGSNISFSGAGVRGAVSGFTVHGLNLALPGVMGTGLSMVVLDKNPLNLGKQNGVEIHGVMGATLFRSFVVNIDYPRHTVYLINKKAFSPCHAAYSSVPLKIMDSKPVVQATIASASGLHSLSLMIDTGFNHELLIKPGHPFPLPSQARHTRIGRGIGGMIRGKTGEIKHVQLNTHIFKEINTLFPAANTYPAGPRPLYHQGTIGNGLLKHHNIILDYAGEMLYIKTPEIPLEKQADPVVAMEDEENTP